MAKFQSPYNWQGRISSPICPTNNQGPLFFIAQLWSRVQADPKPLYLERINYPRCAKGRSTPWGPPPGKLPINGVYSVYSDETLLLGWSVWKIVGNHSLDPFPRDETSHLTPNLVFLLLRPPRQHMPSALAEERWRTITISSFGIDSLLTNFDASQEGAP